MEQHTQRFITFSLLVVATSVYLPANAQKNILNAYNGQDQKQSTVVSEIPSAHTDRFDVNIFQDNNTEKFIISVINHQNSKLKIRLNSSAGELYQFDTSDLITRKRFNLSNAEDGIYTLTISDGKNEIKRQINLQTNTSVTRHIAVNNN